MAATNAVYNFWLYELCDVYIVRPFTSRIVFVFSSQLVDNVNKKKNRKP